MTWKRLQASADAYKELARLEVEVTDNEIVVTLHDPDPDLEDILADEFANHALSETIRRARG